VILDFARLRALLFLSMIPAARAMRHVIVVALLAGALSCAVSAAGRADAAFVGKVVGPDKAPIAGASITAYMPGQNTAQPMTVVTSADGSFSIPMSVAPRGFCLCVVQAKGFGIGGGFLSTANTTTIQLALPGSVTGTVIDQNQAPVAGVTVTVINVKQSPSSQFWLSGLPSMHALVTATTDVHGKYVIDDLPQGSTAGISITDPKYESSIVDESVGGANTPLVARPGATIAGQVLDSDGKPVVGLGLMAAPEAQGSIINPAQSTTDASGNFVLSSLKAGVYDVVSSFQLMSAPLRTDDWVLAPVTGIVAKAGSVTKVPAISTVHGGTISGTVTAADTGKPIPGVGVVSIGDGRFANSSMVTNDRGQFKLVVVPGKVRVVVQSAPDDYLADQQANSHSVGIASGETQQIAFQLKRALSVSGTVDDDSGNPVPDLSLTLSATDQSDDWQQHAATTKADGSFTIAGLGAHQYSVSVKGSWKLVNDTITVTPSTTGAVSIQVKHIDLLSLAAKIVDQTGAPIAGVHVTFSTATASGRGYYMGGQEVVDSDAQGKAGISDISPGELIQSVNISKEGYVLVSGAKISGDVDHYTISDAVLALQNASISGFVHGPTDAPVAGAWVICPGGGGPDTPVQTDSSGRFQLNQLINGQIEIYAAKGDLYGSKSVQTGSSSRITITIGPGRALASADMARAITILDTANSASASVGEFAYGELAATIGAYDPDLAMKFLADNGIAPTDDAVQHVITARAAQNPEAAANWGYPRIVAMTDPEFKEQAAADIGFALVRTDPALARKFYDLARANPSPMDIGEDPGARAVEVAALGAALGQPEARALMETAVADFTTANTNGKGLSKYNGPDVVKSIESAFVGVMAAGSIDLATELLPLAAKDQMSWQESQIAEVASMTNPASAVAYFQSMDSGGPNGWAYGRAAQYVLPIIAKTDPQGALKIAEGLSANDNGDGALVAVANMLPLSEAEGLYRKAAAMASGNQGTGAPIGWIAGQAGLRDKSLGQQLFADALTNVETEAAQQEQQGQNYVPVEQSLADFGFYEARADPGLSRVIIEKQFSKDLKSGESNDPAEVDAIAMAAVDVDRALDMAYLLPQTYDRINAARMIAAYVLLTPEARLRIRFENWWSGNTWAPGRQVMY
jgi:hypothetical protein